MVLYILMFTYPKAYLHLPQIHYSFPLKIFMEPRVSFRLFIINGTWFSYWCLKLIRPQNHPYRGRRGEKWPRAIGTTIAATSFPNKSRSVGNAETAWLLVSAKGLLGPYPSSSQKLSWVWDEDRVSSGPQLWPASNGKLPLQRHRNRPQTPSGFCWISLMLTPSLQKVQDKVVFSLLFNYKTNSC